MEDSFSLVPPYRRRECSDDRECAPTGSKRGTPHSDALRSHVISSVRAGLSCRNAATKYGVSVSAVRKWMRQFSRTGRLTAKTAGGDRSLLLKSERAWILARMAAEPHLTAAKLHQELCARGIRVGILSVQRLLKKEEIDWR